MRSCLRVVTMVVAAVLLSQISSPLPVKGQTPPQGPARAGGPAPAGAPAAAQGRGAAQALVSPEVAPDGRVTFRLAASSATQVSANISGQPAIAMQKDERGTWTGTSEPLDPGIYGYTFTLDGARITDPSNPTPITFFQCRNCSRLLVPGDNPWTPVVGAPRGAVAQHLYQSAVTNNEREFYVYTPPGYDPKRRQPYPVAFLMHGLNEDAKTWINQGANTTLDNLINQGKAVPMILVTSLAYGMPNGPAGIDAPEMQRNIMRIMKEEVMPAVYRQYHASTRAADHAIAGLSMGGGETLLGGLNNLDQFAWFGAFSAALVNWQLTIPFAEPPARPEVAAAVEAARARVAAAQAAARAAAPPAAAGAPPAGRAQGAAPAGRGGGSLGSGPVFEARLPLLFPNLNARTNSQIKLLWIGIGGADPSVVATEQFNAFLDSRGIKYTYKVAPGEPHWWPLWRRQWAEFAQLIFK